MYCLIRKFLITLFFVACFLDGEAQITGIKIAGDTCSDFTFDIQATGTSSSSYFFWNFDDPSSGVNDTITITGLSNPPYPKHTFSKPGVYKVCVSLKEPGSPVATVCRALSIGLCCYGVISSSDTCLQNMIPFSIKTATAISSVTWDFGDPSSGVNNTSNALTPKHIFSTTGNYSVKANIVASCGSFQLNYPLKIVTCSAQCSGVILSNDTCILSGTSFQVTSINKINTIEWLFDDPSSGVKNTSTLVNANHVFTSTGTYNIQAIVSFSCGVDTLMKMLRIGNCDTMPEICQLYVPSGFTPNSDGKNDFFYAISICIIQDYEFHIFNRWGEQIFKTFDPKQKWDGKYKGSDCENGVYTYLIKYKFSGQPSKFNSGTITLLR